MCEENLVHIPGYEGYLITVGGKIFSTKQQRWLKGCKRSSGHICVGLLVEGKQVFQYVHRLVLQTFVGDCPAGLECRHLDGNPQNNHLSNLKWDTHKENMLDKDRHLRWNRQGRKLSDEKARMIVHMHRTGEFTLQEIADIYGVSRNQINLIVKRKAWKGIWKK